MALETKHGRGFKIDRHWTRDYLFLHTCTSAIFVLEGQEIIVPKNSVILYHVNTPQLYYESDESYSDDFIHFLTENDNDFFEKLKFPFNTIIELQNTKTVNDLLRHIYLEYTSQNVLKKISTDLLLKLLFTKVSEQITRPHTLDSNNKYFDLLSRLWSDIYLHPERDWSVQQMSKYTNLSVSYIQYKFKQTFRVSCFNAVINSRMERAKSLLNNSYSSIKEIATRCGYNNDIAFMRQFKKSTGKTPSEFRSENYISMKRL